jgi:hypothetical protein
VPFLGSAARGRFSVPAYTRRCAEHSAGQQTGMLGRLIPRSGVSRTCVSKLLTGVSTARTWTRRGSPFCQGAGAASWRNLPIDIDCLRSRPASGRPPWAAEGKGCSQGTRLQGAKRPKVGWNIPFREANRAAALLGREEGYAASSPRNITGQCAAVSGA